MGRSRGIRTILIVVSCVLILVGQSVGLALSASAQRHGGPEQVRAMVHCDGATLTVTVDNQFWNSVAIRYIAAFGGPVNPYFFWTESDVELGTRIDKGTRWSIELTVMESPTRDSGPVVGTMVVTSAGVLMPTCDGGYSPLMDDPGNTPADIVDANRILTTAAMITIGRLESLRAWDALYALLHPDVQALIAPAALACWYADQYGTRDDPKESVQATEVDAIGTVSDWEWIAGGITYRQAIQVDYTQTIGTLMESREETGTMHFVEIDGEPHWFFGNRVDSLNHLDTTCGA